VEANNMSLDAEELGCFLHQQVHLFVVRVHGLRAVSATVDERVLFVNEPHSRKVSSPSPNTQFLSERGKRALANGSTEVAMRR
jgi:hypothetical protein